MRPWSAFFYQPGDNNPGGRAADPGAGIYPFQITATVANVNAAALSGISSQICSHTDWKASQSLVIDWTFSEMFYDETKQSTMISYALTIVNYQRAVAPTEIRLDVYDPNFRIIKQVPVYVTLDETNPNKFGGSAVFPITISTAGDYHFVVEARQKDEIGEGKDRNKWALEQNGSVDAPPFAVFGGYSPGGNSKFPGVAHLDTTWGVLKVRDTLKNEIGYADTPPARVPWWFPTLAGYHDYQSERLSADKIVGTTGLTPDTLSFSGNFAAVHAQTMQYSAVWLFAGHAAAGTTMGVYSGHLQLPRASEVDDPEDWGYILKDNTIKPPGGTAGNAVLGDLPRTYHGRAIRSFPTADDWRLQSATSGQLNMRSEPLIFSNLIVFDGCNTAINTPVFGKKDLPQTVVSLGARASIGIYGTITGYNNIYFSNELFKWLKNGRTLEDAAQTATSYARFVQGTGYKAWYRTQGDSSVFKLDATHVRWGDPNNQGPEKYSGTEQP